MTGCRAMRNSVHTVLAFVVVLTALSGCSGVFPPADGGTQFSEVGCGTSYSDTRYDYGFELPDDATLVRTKNESNSLTNSLWTLEVGDALINIITRVQGASAEADLGTVVSFANNLSVSAGADLLGEEEVVLANGEPGILTTIRFDGLTTFRIQTLSKSRMYLVESVIEESKRSADLDDALLDVVLSLCVGE